VARYRPLAFCDSMLVLRSLLFSILFYGFFAVSAGGGRWHIAHCAEIFATIHQILVAYLARDVPRNLRGQL